MQNAQLLNHPIILDKLSQLRNKNTLPPDFRKILNEIGFFLAYELLRDYPLKHKSIETPLQKMKAPTLEVGGICLVSVLRAGNGLLDGFLKIFPDATIGHLGLSRDPKTFEISEYYLKFPGTISDHDVIVLDPMLATGHSASVALEKIEKTKPKSIKLVSLLSAPEGIEYLKKKYPKIPIYTAAIDEKLNSKKYIVPGLGDAGDRYFGTL